MVCPSRGPGGGRRAELLSVTAAPRGHRTAPRYGKQDAAESRRPAAPGAGPRGHRGALTGLSTRNGPHPAPSPVKLPTRTGAAHAKFPSKANLLLSPAL